MWSFVKALVSRRNISTKLFSLRLVIWRSHSFASFIKAIVSRRTGWRRLIGSPNLQIIFHKRVTKYRSLLRKMTFKDKGSYESSPPCTNRRAYLYARIHTLAFRAYIHSHPGCTHCMQMRTYSTFDILDSMHTQTPPV